MSARIRFCLTILTIAVIGSAGGEQVVAGTPIACACVSCDDNPAADVAAFYVEGGRAVWFTLHEHRTERYLIEGCHFPNGTGTPLVVEPAGIGHHMVTVPTSEFPLLRLVEIEIGGTRKVWGIARARGPNLRGTERGTFPGDKVPGAHWTSDAPTSSAMAWGSTRPSQRSTAYDLEAIRARRRHKPVTIGSHSTQSSLSPTYVIFTVTSYLGTVQNLVANYWQGKGHIVEIVDVSVYPDNPPGNRRAMIKADIVNYWSQYGTKYFHLIGDAGPDIFASSLWETSSYWKSKLESYTALGLFPAANDTAEDIIPTYVIPDEQGGPNNTARRQPYILSDHEYGDTDNDGVPDVVVTRWPVLNEGAIVLMADKMQEHNDRGSCAAQSASFFVGDVNYGSGSTGDKARHLADELEQKLIEVAPSENVTRLYETDYPDHAVRNWMTAFNLNFYRPEVVVLFSSLSRSDHPGQFFYRARSNPNLAGQWDMTMMEDGAIIPILIGASCESAAVHSLAAPCGDFLFEPGKGSVAWAGPKGGSWQQANYVLVSYLIEELYQNPERPMGESWLVAIQRAHDAFVDSPDHLNTIKAYVFFGDPVSPFRPTVYSVSGYVTDDQGVGVEGLEVEAIKDGGGNASSTCVTESNGFYDLVLPSNWSGTVSPEPTYYNDFTPSTHQYTNLSLSYTNENFVASHLQSQWVTNGLGVGAAAGSQSSVASIADAPGGVLLAWVDRRTGGADIFAQKVDGSGDKLWGPTGRSVCWLSGDQTETSVAEDGTGGVYVVWADERDEMKAKDVYMQRLGPAGDLLLGNVSSPICTTVAVQSAPKVIADGASGAIVAWEDYRDASSGADIYAARVNSGGTKLWGPDENGLAVCTAVGDQRRLAVCPDGQGGAIMVWQDERAQPSTHIYVQRVDSGGNLAWSPASGVPICTVTGFNSSPAVLPDGEGGAFVAFLKIGNDGYPKVSCQRVLADGSVAWAPNGIEIFDILYTTVEKPRIVADGQGGAIITWVDHRSVIDLDIYAQRVDASGATLWADNGNPICVASGNQDNPTIAPNSVGGAIICWEDGRSGGAGFFDIYAEIVGLNGHVFWGNDGIKITDASDDQMSPIVVSDGGNGAIIAWQDRRNGNWDIYADRLQPNAKWGAMAASESWDGEVYVVGDLAIGGSATVTIAPGTSVLVSLSDWDPAPNDTSGVLIDVQGGLDVNGTQGSPVTFAAWDGSVVANNFGAWEGLFIQAGSPGATLDWCTIKGAETAIRAEVTVTLNDCVIDTVAAAGISATNTTVTVRNTTIKNSLANGIELIGSGATIVNSTIEGCSSYGTRLDGGGALTIKNVQFLNNDTGLYVANNSIDGIVDSLCTFRDNDIGIHYYASSRPSIRHCKIENNTTDGIFLNYYSSPSISYCITSQNYAGKIANNGAGIYCVMSSSPTIMFNAIQNNQVGIGAVDDANPNAGGGPGSSGDNIITGSTSHHIVNLSPGVTIMAENNWWGSTRPPKPNKFSGSVDYVPVASSQPDPSLPKPDIPTPTSFALFQNHPNPFNPRTTIPYDVPAGGGQVTIRIYNVAGQLVRTLVDEYRDPGRYEIVWDGRNERGNELASSVYFLSMRAGEFRSTKKLVILK